MGARWSELWIRASEAGAARAAEELGPELVPGRFGRLSQDDFEAELACPDRWGDLGAREPSEEFGEAVYVAMYDGPAGELCGTFLYERAVDGEVTRALVWAPGADQTFRWFRVEGTPEPWEAEVVAEHLDAAIERTSDERRWLDPPLPPLTDAERADLRRRWSRFVEGETGPKINEYVLSSRALGQVRD